MLQKLYIKNFVLIQEEELLFSDGYTAVTGETGAGKSILLNAIQLILGSRANLSAIGNPEEKCIVEGYFKVDPLIPKAVFEENDLDYEAISVFRRELLPSGKSRAFINDTPVKLDLLQEFATKLIDIHEQHQTLKLKNNDFQCGLLDAYAGNLDAIKTYRSEFRKLKADKKELEQLKELQIQSEKDRDYFQFQFEELDAIPLDADAYVETKERLEWMENAEQLQSSIGQGVEILENENGVLDLLNSLESSLPKNKSEKLDEIIERITSSKIELQEVQTDLGRFLDMGEVNPNELEALADEMNQINSLFHKHHVTEIEELIAIKNELSDKLESISAYGTQIVKLEASIKEQENKCLKLATDIDQQRKKHKSGLEKELQELLAALAMENARFEVELKACVLSHNGISDPAFMFSANPGMALQPIDKAASGGELSRLMLSLKSIYAKKSHLPTILFDEIDNGISGAVASKAGSILADLGKTIQVFSITHLPQVASKAKHHMRVEKSVTDGKTTTEVKSLNPDERIVEIAKMLSGETVQDSAIKTAKELLKN
jgi:DNA repair protein RecN (Recombination protein N)